jgi:tRNA threonylcarbamoyladenosine biosynthesis protein TsaB
MASVCLSENGYAVAVRENNQQKEHAAFVHKAIEAILSEAGKELRQVDAFAVTSGPGSYTGLRVGLATAKGFCYALHKPLITINTLKVMLQAAIERPVSLQERTLLYCPMIDARRSEVYTALYNQKGESLFKPAAMILDEHSFETWLEVQPILFFGNGSEKFKAFVRKENAVFANLRHNATHLGKLSFQQFEDQIFADLAYAEPEYLKEFHAVLK